MALEQTLKEQEVKAELPFFNSEVYKFLGRDNSQKSKDIQKFSSFDKDDAPIEFYLLDLENNLEDSFDEIKKDQAIVDTINNFLDAAKSRDDLENFRFFFDFEGYSFLKRSVEQMREDFHKFRFYKDGIGEIILDFAEGFEQEVKTNPVISGELVRLLDDSKRFNVLYSLQNITFKNLHFLLGKERAIKTLKRIIKKNERRRIENIGFFFSYFSKYNGELTDDVFPVLRSHLENIGYKKIPKILDMLGRFRKSKFFGEFDNNIEGVLKNISSENLQEELDEVVKKPSIAFYTSLNYDKKEIEYFMENYDYFEGIETLYNAVGTAPFIGSVKSKVKRMLDIFSSNTNLSKEEILSLIRDTEGNRKLEGELHDKIDLDAYHNFEKSYEVLYLFKGERNVTVKVSRDPMEILRVGEEVDGTCLSFDNKDYNWGSMPHLEDVNKNVIYFHFNGEIVARNRTAITSEGDILFTNFFINDARSIKFSFLNSFLQDYSNATKQRLILPSAFFNNRKIRKKHKFRNLKERFIQSPNDNGFFGDGLAQDSYTATRLYVGNSFVIEPEN